MTLDKLDYVLTLAEERNMRRAAAKLYISQPGLTAYINKLERYLGVKLFDRTVTPIQVTEAGALYISRMKELRQSETMLRSQLAEMGNRRRTLRIGIGVTRGSLWLPYLLPPFQKMHPEVSVRILESGIPDLESAVANGTIDVAFGALNLAFSELIYESLREEMIYCVVPRTAPCARGLPSNVATVYNPASIEPEALADMTFLTPSPANGFYQFTEKLYQQFDIHIKDTVPMTNLDTAYQLVALGCGALISNAFDFHRNHPELHDKLAFFYLGDTPIYRTSRMAYDPDSPNADLVGDLKKIVYERLLPVVNEGYPHL